MLQKIEVKASREYEVLVGEGLMKKIGRHAQLLICGRHAVIVSDSNVWPLYGKTVEESLDKAGFTVDHFVFPAGEQSKSLKTLGEILTYLATHEMTRSDVVVALGGGVAGDMGGLAASLYLRGIPCIQVPTSLLAMVDSSVGGKTAVDLPEGKNLVGTFTQPYLVLCDTDALKTLEPAVYAEGFAEVIKYGMIRSRRMLDFLMENEPGAGIDRVIAECVTIKRDIVARDEHDTGERQVLNFGHTIGHAIERCSNYKYYHGEGVAMGMAILTRHYVETGDCPEECLTILEALLDKYHLPKSCDIEPKKLLEAARADKKRRGNGITLIVPEYPGKCRLNLTDYVELAEVLGVR